MDIYAAPVLCLVGAWIVQIRRNRTIDLAMLALISAVVVLIAGLRWYSDVDYPLYMEMYNDNPSLRDFSADAIASLYGEPGYLLFTAVFKSLGAGLPTLGLTCAILSVSMKSIVAARLCKHASLAMALYLCFHFITNEFIQMRWAVATGFIVLGFYFQFMRRWKKAVLAFLLSAAFHYFSVIFWLVALLLPLLNSYKRLYLLLGVSVIGAVFLRFGEVAPLLVTNSDLYILSRITRYATVEASPIGVLSIVKLLMYPVIYAGCVMLRPSSHWTTDRLNMFLLKVAFLSLSLTLALTFMPILHYRASIVADFFSIILVLNALSHALERNIRTTTFAVMTVLFCTWYILDIRNYVRANRLYEYKTWLTET